MTSNRVGSNWSGGSYLDPPPGESFDPPVIVHGMDFLGNIFGGYAHGDGTAALQVGPGLAKTREFAPAATPTNSSLQVDVDGGVLDRLLLLDDAVSDIIVRDAFGSDTGTTVGFVKSGSPPGIYVMGVPYRTGLRLVGNIVNPAMTIVYWSY